MDHQFGRIDLVTWQGRRNRRLKTGVSPWTILLVVCAVLGAAAMTAQGEGWVHWTGPVAAAPAALVLIALSVQLVAVARAALTWLAG